MIKTQNLAEIYGLKDFSAPTFFMDRIISKERSNFLALVNDRERFVYRVCISRVEMFIQFAKCWRGSTLRVRRWVLELVKRCQFTDFSHINS